MSAPLTYNKPFASACRDATTASTGVKVAKIYSAAIPLVLFSAATAVVSFYCFFRWYVLEPIQRGKVWRLHSWFCACICCCSVLSLLTWPSYSAQYLYSVYSDEAEANSSNSSQARAAYLNAAASDWQIVFNISYPVEFLLMSVIKTVILTRMTLVVQAASRSAVLKRRILVLQQAVMALVALGCVVGICGNIATSVSMYQVARYYRETGDAWIKGDMLAVTAANQGVDVYFEENEKRTSVQCLAEIIVLLSIIVGYILSAFFVLSSQTSAARATSAAMLEKHIEKMRYIRRQIIIVVFVTFVSLLVRCVYAFMNALAGLLYRISRPIGNTSSATCEDLCADCRSVGAILDTWLDFAPNFQCWIIFFSEPVTLLVSLWGMISPESRLLLFAPASQRRETVALTEFDTESNAPPRDANT